MEVSRVHVVLHAHWARSKVGEADALLENARACVFAQWLGRKQLRPLRRAQLTRPHGGWRHELKENKRSDQGIFELERGLEKLASAPADLPCTA